MSGLPPPLRALLLLLVSVVVLTLGWGFALGSGTRSPEPSQPVEAAARSPLGRKLYLFVFDALDAREVHDLPVLSALAARGTAVELEPCLDRFTTACVKEALTGRALLDLFAPFENFGLGGARTGTNLLRDARAAGLRVAMVSTGDLRPFQRDIDEDLRVPEPPRGTEVALGLEAAARADLVVHHWVWHDVAAHRMKSRPEEHSQSLREADAAVGQILAGLPEGMDLIVAGDHGHGPDGRHLQGMDVPTALVGLSPNLVPGDHIGGGEPRTSIAAVRFLGSASLGLIGPSTPGLASLGALVPPALRQGWEGRPAGEEARPGPGLGFGLLALCVGGLVTLASGLAGGLAALWGLGLGASYPDYMALVEQRRGGSGFYAYTWVVPALGAALGYLRRREPDGGWLGAALGGALLLAGLHPGLDASGALQNMTEIAAPGVIGAAVILLMRRGALQPRRALVLAVGAVCVWYSLEQLSVLDANFFRVRSYTGASWARREPVQADLLAALLAGLGHLLLEGPTGWALVSALAAGLGRQLPPWVHIGTASALTFGLLVLRGRWRTRAIALGVAASSAYLYSRVQQIGVLAVIAVAGTGLRVIAGAPWSERASRLSAGLLVVGASYVGVAWTCAVSAGGIDYTFVVQWTTGRWHERLWWLMFLASGVQIFAPALVIGEHVRRALGARADAVMAAATRLTLLRFGMLLAFVTGWLLRFGGEAVTLRLSAILQDLLAWLLLSLALAGAYSLGSLPGIGRPKQGRPEQGQEDA